MKTCPLGHQNPDDAPRCVVCLRRFSAAPLTLAITGAPDGTVRLEAGDRARLTLAVAQHGGEAGLVAVELSGEAEAWASLTPATLELAPDQVAETVLLAEVPPGTAPGLRQLVVEASGPGEDAPTTRAEILLEVRAVEAAPADTVVRPVVVPVEETQPIWTGEVVEPPGHEEETATSGPSGRRRLLVVAVAVLVGLAAVAAGLVVLVGLIRGDDLTPQQALELSSAEARDALDERRADDEARLQELRSEPGWMVQLSSKCAAFDTVDLEGPDGIGVPDGVAESLSGGIGEAGILAFHLGAREQWGDTVLLASSEALALSPCDDGTPRWLTLDAPTSGPYASVGEAMCECRTRGLPFGECGIRATSEDQAIFWRPKNESLACT